LIATDINADLLKLENKAKNVDKYQGGLGFKWGTRPTNIFLANQTLPDLSASEKFLGIRPKLTLSALISFMPEK
jgi:hypothetical protein